jgi:hypothetical protein
VRICRELAPHPNYSSGAGRRGNIELKADSYWCPIERERIDMTDKVVRWLLHPSTTKRWFTREHTRQLIEVFCRVRRGTINWHRSSFYNFFAILLGLRPWPAGSIPATAGWLFQSAFGGHFSARSVAKCGEAQPT